LTVAVANALSSRLISSGYKTVMTKSTVSACLGLLERANKANNAKSNVFVSVHFNAPRTILGIPIAGGSFGIYDPAKSDAMTLAEMVANSTGSAVGVGNDANQGRSGMGVLRVTSSRMTAIIIEVARLSGNSETIVHDPASISNAASGIKAGVDQFLNQ
jgi:N-acetylmuramoyl-L-alanine amidase